MRAGQLKEILEAVDEDTLIVFEYPVTRTERVSPYTGARQRLPGICVVSDAEILCDVTYFAGTEHEVPNCQEIRLTTDDRMPYEPR